MEIAHSFVFTENPIPMITFLKNQFIVFLCVLAFPLAAQHSIALAEVTPEEVPVPVVVSAELPFVAASFPGGTKQLFRQLSERVEYPELAREYAVEGTVVVRLELSATGKIVGQEIIKGIGFGCDEAALQALASLPTWNPARRGAAAVGTHVYVPLRFKLR